MSETMTEQEIIDLLVVNIGELEPGNAEHFTEKGAPKIDALRAKTSIESITAKDVNAAFAKFKAANPEFNGMPNAATPPVAPAQTPKAGKAKKELPDGQLSGDKVSITLHESESEKGDVFIGLNGVGYQIQRNVKVAIPVELLEILDNSTIDTTLKDPDNGKEQAKKIPRYSYQVHR